MVLTAAVLAAALAAPPVPGAAGSAVVVRREGARLMAAPRFFGKACAGRVEAGRPVRIVERRKGWARIAAPGDGRCWLHESAWSDRAAGELAGEQVRASQRDVELAGRGFSEGEESRWRAEHAEVAAAAAEIDAHVERGGEPAAAELERFRAAGRLEGADAGGAP